MKTAHHLSFYVIGDEGADEKVELFFITEDQAVDYVDREYMSDVVVGPVDVTEDQWDLINTAMINL